MKRPENNNWIDNALTEALGAEKSKPNFDKWKKTHLQAVEMLTSRAAEQPSIPQRPPKVISIITKSRVTKLAVAAVIIAIVAVGLMHWLPGGEGVWEGASGDWSQAETEVKIPQELAKMPVEELLDIHFGKAESPFDSSVVAAAVAKALEKLSAREILAIGQKYSEGSDWAACMRATLPPALSRIVEACDFVVHARVEEVELDVSDLKAAIIHKQRNQWSIYSGAPIKTTVQLSILGAYPPLPSDVGEKILFRPVFNSEHIDLLEEGKEYLIALKNHQDTFWLLHRNQGVYPADPNTAMVANLRNGPMPINEVWAFIMDAYDAIHEGALPSAEILDYWLARLQSNDMTDCLTAIEYFNTLPEPVAPQDLVMDAMERFLSGRIIDSEETSNPTDAGLRHSRFTLETLDLLTRVADEPTVERMMALYERHAASLQNISIIVPYWRTETLLPKIIRLALKHPGPKRRQRYLSFFPHNIENLKVTGNQIYLEVTRRDKRMGITLTLEDGILHGEEEFRRRRYRITLEQESKGPVEPAAMPDDMSGPARFQGTWSGSVVQPEELVQGEPQTDYLTLILEIDENGQLVGDALGDFVQERPLEELIEELAKAEGEDINELLMEMLEDPAKFGISNSDVLGLLTTALAQRGLPQFGADPEHFLADPEMGRKEAIQHLLDLYRQGKIPIELMADLLQPEDTELISFLREALPNDHGITTLVADVLPDPCFVPVLRAELEKEANGELLRALFACGQEQEAIEIALARFENPISDDHPYLIDHNPEGVRSHLQQTIIQFLGTTGDESVLPFIEQFTGDGPQEVAVLALGRLGSEAAIPRLQEFYRSERIDIRVRIAAALSLYYLGDDTGYDLLEHFANGTARSLPQIHPLGGHWLWHQIFEEPALYLRSPRTDELLLESYRSSHFCPCTFYAIAHEVGSGICAFAREYERKILPILVDQLTNRNPATRKYVNALLKHLTGEDFGFQPEKFVGQQTEAIERWRSYVDEYLAQTAQPAE